MMTKVYNLFQLIRSRWFPHRIQKYGLVGLAISDDRTKIEKFIDKIDNKLLDLKLRSINERQSKRGFWQYFDWSLGLWIDSTNTIKDIERTSGMTYVSIKEWEKYKAIAQRERDRMFEHKLAEDVKQVIRDVKQGRSFVKESAENRRRIYEQYGKK